MKKFVAFLGMVFALASFLALAAQASSVVPIGSSLTMIGQNAPDNYSSTTTFGTTSLIDGGAVSLTTSQISDGAGGEWDIFALTTVNGGPIGGDPSLDWSLGMNYDISQPANFVGVVNQWSVNGVPVNPIQNFGGIVNAGTGFLGEGYYNSGFSAPLTVGEFTSAEWNQIFVNPYNFATSGGIPVTTANGFTFALDLQPQSAPPSVPEPGTMLLMSLGVAGAAFLRKGMRKNA